MVRYHPLRPLLKKEKFQIALLFIYLDVLKVNLRNESRKEVVIFFFLMNKTSFIEIKPKENFYSDE